MRLALLLVSVLSVFYTCHGARILGVWHMEAPSHFFLGNKLLKTLAARGHEITMISAFPQKTPVKNYRDVVISGQREKLMELMPKDKKVDFVELGQMHFWKQIIFTSVIGSKVSEITLEHENVQKLLSNPKEKFDLVIFEMFHSEIFYGLAHKYDVPVVVVSTLGSSSWTNHLTGNPAPNSYVPNLFLNFSGQMNLMERIYNTFVNLFHEIYTRFVYFPQLDATLHKFFPDAPPIFDLMYNRTAMILLNSHPAISEPKPHVPAMVEVGGFHVEDAKPLPKDLQEFMDRAKEGVILFSMGSNFKSTELDAPTRDKLLGAFGRLRQKVIWKWEDDNLPGKPDNVKIMKWCPQNDIMAHPNLKMFITHGGLLSTTEAIYHGVPVIGIPIFGDQKMNVAMTQRKGYGIGINYNDLTEDRLVAAINEVLVNPSYRQAARTASQVIRGQPVRPIDAAVFWVEHVIQHKGADHFRSAAMNLSWCELYSVDVIGLIVLVDIIVFLVFYYICRKIICGRKTQKINVKDSKKKKA